MILNIIKLSCYLGILLFLSCLSSKNFIPNIITTKNALELTQNVLEICFIYLTIELTCLTTIFCISTFYAFKENILSTLKKTCFIALCSLILFILTNIILKIEEQIIIANFTDITTYFFILNFYIIFSILTPISSICIIFFEFILCIININKDYGITYYETKVKIAHNELREIIERKKNSIDPDEIILLDERIQQLCSEMEYYQLQFNQIFSKK